MAMNNDTQAYYFANCVAWPEGETEQLCEMIDLATLIKYQTFYTNVHVPSLNQLTKALGYTRSFPIRRDSTVNYFSSEYKNCKVYYLRHSAIEYVFACGTEPGNPVPTAAQLKLQSSRAVQENFGRLHAMMTARL